MKLKLTNNNTLFNSLLIGLLLTCILAVPGLALDLLNAHQPFVVGEDLKIERNNLLLLQPVSVEKVYDGDTFLTAGGRRVRLIGIDCPEMNYEEGRPEYFARKALEFSRERLKNKVVYLEYDIEKKDNYDRYLAYVFLADGTFFNALLLDRGYAHLMTVPPNTGYLELYQELARGARKDGRGIWTVWDDIEEKEISLISWKEAERYLGREVIVSGRVVDTYDAGDAVFINFDREYRETLSLVIFSRDLNKFDYNPADYLLHEEIMVRGVIEEYEGAPEIIIDDPLQIFIKK